MLSLTKPLDEIQPNLVCVSYSHAEIFWGPTPLNLAIYVIADAHSFNDLKWVIDCTAFIWKMSLLFL